MDTWICPKCGTRNDTTSDDARIMILKEEWDFCKHCDYELDKKWRTRKWTLKTN